MERKWMRRASLLLLACMLFGTPGLERFALADDATPAQASTREPAPTEEPTATPTAEPTATPTAEPTATPTAEPTATPTSEPTATPTAEPTATPTSEPAATPEPARIVSFDVSELPEGISVPYGTLEADIGLPSQLTAAFSDGAIMPVAVTWVCVSDGLGGAAYNPTPEGDAQPLYLFEARLARELPCEAALPRVGVALLERPNVMAVYTLKQLGFIGGELDGYQITGTEITLTNGTYTYNGGEDTTAPTRIIVSGTAELRTRVNVPANVEVNGGFFTATDATLAGVTLSRGTCVISGCTIEGQLNMAWLPASGRISITGGSVSSIAFDSIMGERLLDAGWLKRRPLLIPGEPAEVIEAGLDRIELSNVTVENIPHLKVTYTPTSPEKGKPLPEGGSDVRYRGEIFVGEAESPSYTKSDFQRKTTTVLVLVGGNISKTYDGTNAFVDATVDQPQWKVKKLEGEPEEYSGAAPECTVIVTAATGENDTNAGSYSGIVPTNVDFRDDFSLENTVLSSGPEYATLTATIEKAPVTLSGTVYRDEGVGTTFANEREQSTLTVTGLVNGEGREALGNLTLKGVCSNGNEDDLLTQAISSPATVTAIEGDSGSNYTVTPNGMRVAYRVSSNPTLTMEDWYIGPGQLPFPTPTVENLGDENRGYRLEYRMDGEDDNAWTEAQPTAEGEYQVRAVLEANNEYIAETTAPVSFTVHPLAWTVNLIRIGSLVYGRDLELIAHITTTEPEGNYISGYQTSGKMAFLIDGESVGVGEYDEREALFSITASGLDAGGHTMQAVYTGTDGKTLQSEEFPFTVEKRYVVEALGSETTNDYYNGLTGTDGERAYIRVNFKDAELKPEDFTVSLTQDGVEYTPAEGELVEAQEGITFYPHRVGGYEMTVAIREDHPHYGGAYTGSTYVSQRDLTFEPVGGTIEFGQPFEPAYGFDDETSLAPGDRVVSDSVKYSYFADPYASSPEDTLTPLEPEKMDAGTYPFAVWPVDGLRIEAADGTDVTDQYKLSLSIATLTINPRTVVASFATDSLSDAMEVTWNPDLWFNVEDQARESLRFLVKNSDGSYTDARPNIGSDFDIAWSTEGGEPLDDAPEDAGTYKLTVSLMNDNYAFPGGAFSATLTFIIRPLDLTDNENVRIEVIGKSYYDYDDPGQELPPDGPMVQVEIDGVLSSPILRGDDVDFRYKDGENHTEPGTAYFWAVGISPNVTGEKRGEYEIVAKPRYTITIPASVSADETMTIRCEGFTGSFELSVVAFSENHFALVDPATGKSIAYELEGTGEGALGAPEVIFRKEKGTLEPENQSAKLSFRLDLSALPEPGSYADTLAFGIGYSW